MADVAALKRLREGRFFGGWDGFVSADLVAASEANLQRLIDDLIASEPGGSEDSARRLVDACVRRFNDMDEDGWICTIERDDIFEQVGRVVDACGFEYDEDWVSERDW